jgi:hypothetical protein
MLNYFSKDRLNEDKYLLLGHGFFFVLLVFSFILAYERVLWVDSGAQVFEFIRDEWYNIYVRRYSMYLFQSFPILAIKLHLPLSVVIYSYSLSVPVIGYILWLITVYFLKDRKAGILMLFIMLGIRHTFFHAISETFQLMFFASFLYVWLFQARDYRKSVFSKIGYYFIACIFIALCVFIHPVSAFFVLFMLGMYFLNRNIPLFQKIFMAIASIVIILLKFLDTAEGSHDMNLFVGLYEIFNRIPKMFTFSISLWYFDQIQDCYWMPMLMLIVSLFFYLKKKCYWHFTFLLGFVILFWITTVIIYIGIGGIIGAERAFLPLFFFCGIPFLIEVFPNLSVKMNKVFFIGLTVLLVMSFVKIADVSIPYTQRLEKIEQISIMANQQGKKKILIEKEMAKQIFPVDTWTWGLGFESMLYTASKDIDSTVNMYIVDKIDLEEKQYQNPEVYFAVPWWRFWKIDNLNPHYFKLPKQLPSILVLENGELVIKEL